MSSLEHRDRVTRALLGFISCAGLRAAEGAELSDSEWEAVARAAVRHGVAPIVHARLSEAGVASRAPEQVTRLLKGYFVRTGLENLRLFSRLAPLLQALAEHSIEAIVLKGAYLAEAVYGNPALRSMGDADVLVRRTDLQRAEQLLCAHGWQQPMPLHTETALPSGHQLPTFELDSVQVEIHWSIENDESPFLIDGDGLFERAGRVRIGGAPALALSSEDLLLHLCLHTAYNHGWLPFGSGLRPLCDIAATISHCEDRLDWNLLGQRADAWGVRNCAWLTLTLVRDLLSVAVPDGTLERLAPRVFDRGLVDTAIDLTLNDYYAIVLKKLPAISPPWLTRRWWRLSRTARWSRHFLPKQRRVALAYPSLGTAPAPLRYAAYWGDLARDTVRLSLTREGRALRSREHARRRLGAWLEGSTGSSAIHQVALGGMPHF